MNIKNTTKFRLLVVLSIVWIVFTMTVDGNIPKPFVLIVVNSPVWVFWSSVWIWKSKFENFFGVGEKAKRKKELNEWVYWDIARAKKHKLYGIKGWALLLSIALILPNIIHIALGIYPFELIGQVNELMIEEYAGYKELLVIGSIQTWIFTGLSLFTLYLLISHKDNFQKFYVILFISSLISDLAYFIATIQILNMGENDALMAAFHTFRFYISGFIWLLYVLKSKRINLTTKNRIKKRYENATFF